MQPAPPPGGAPIVVCAQAAGTQAGGGAARAGPVSCTRPAGHLGRHTHRAPGRVHVGFRVRALLRTEGSNGGNVGVTRRTPPSECPPLAPVDC